MRGLTSILFLIISNFFMTFAWYGHLQFKKWNVFQTTGLIGLILISWAIALFEYMFMVPANRLGFNENGGPFNLFQLKILQEVITLVVFSFCAIVIFKTDKLQWNYLVGFGFLILAVFFIFKKWN
ncbi:MAG: DMT family protein [Bacteroidetes bacterium]|nr:DMT family protein [Bacteroidota bacterium]